MTDYTRRTTIACPASLIDDANQFALVLGESPTDDRTFGTLGWQDANGNLYAVASTVATETFQPRATEPLTAPDHAPDADLEAAGRAQAALVIGTLAEPATATPTTLAAIVGASTDSALDHLAAMGLTRVPIEESL